MEWMVFEKWWFGRWVLRPAAVLILFGVSVLWVLEAAESGALDSPFHWVGLALGLLLLGLAKGGQALKHRRFVRGIEGMEVWMLCCYFLGLGFSIAAFISATSSFVHGG